MSNQIGMASNEAAVEVLNLRKIVEEFGNQANQQTQQMIKLSRSILYLTIIMTMAVLGQIFMAIMNR